LQSIALSPKDTGDLIAKLLRIYKDGLEARAEPTVQAAAN
jgi:hypothetical protein